MKKIKMITYPEIRQTYYGKINDPHSEYRGWKFRYLVVDL
jgi:hypothetical protein